MTGLQAPGELPDDMGANEHVAGEAPNCTEPALSLRDAALELRDAGMSVVRVRGDGTKVPEGLWKQCQTTRAAREQVAAWFADGGDRGLGVLSGPVSGGLEMLELEGRAMPLLPELGRLLVDHGQTELLGRLLVGWSERSPGDGLHLLYRIEDALVLPNTNWLCPRPSPPPGPGS